jgi:hypothetical protein
VEVDGASLFLVSPVELATKIPDPHDLFPPGLWPSAHGHATSLAVVGPSRYRLRRAAGGEWTAAGGGRAARPLKAFAAVITARNAVGAPTLAPARLGLDPPLATATLCARPPPRAAPECRTFRFGEATVDGQRRTYAVGPGMDPVELRDDEWRLLVRGPFAR